MPSKDLEYKEFKARTGGKVMLWGSREIKDIYGSTEHINKNLNWHYDLTINELLDILLEEEMSQ